jgi:thiamine pyrophosphokinase
MTPKDEKHFAIVANGELGNAQAMLQLIQRHTHIIAADGGMNHLDRLHVKPELIIGDLDSIDKKLLEKYKDVPQKIFPHDKDASDLELAIDTAFEMGAKKITLYGALHGRSDHNFANLLLLQKKPGSIFIETENELLTAISDQYELLCKKGQTISFFSLGDTVDGVTTQGLKWELDSKTIDHKFYSLSNIALSDKISFKIRSGVLLLCVQK